MEIAYSRLNDGQKRRLAKIFESEAESSPANKKKFQYNKNLRNSKYNEFLEESDEEDVFKTKPKTKDGNEYQFDFKIDLYRDMIKYKKTGNDKQLLVSNPSQATLNEQEYMSNALNKVNSV